MDLYDIVESVAVLLISLVGVIMMLFPNRVLKKEYQKDEKVIAEYRRKGFVLLMAGLLCFAVVITIKLRG